MAKLKLSNRSYNIDVGYQQLELYKHDFLT